MQEEQKEVDRIEALLREHGHSVEPVGAEAEAGGQETDYQIYMGVERVRVSEVIFQPSMVGIDAMPLDYLAQHILSSLPPAAQSALEKVTLLFTLLSLSHLCFSQNIFLTGGNTLYPQMVERLQTSVRSLRPVDSVVKVWRANDPLLDPWRGMRLWASQPHFKESCITRELYNEYGGDYLKEHHFSNIYSSLGS